MISYEQLDELLQSRETQVIDFKGGMYDLRSPRGINGKGYLDLLKDVLAMANTPRNQSAYIVIGVVNKSHSPNVVKGITLPIDDNDIQQRLKQWCNPVPNAQYYDLVYKGKTLGIIEIFLDRGRGPFFIRTDLSPAQERILQPEDKFLQSGVLYFRQGTTNTIATPVDQAYITKWFASANEEHWQNWDDFKQASHYFTSERHYILITSPLSDFPSDVIAELGNIGWTGVIDFDQVSDTQGLLNAVQSSLHQNLTRVTKGETPSINPRQGLYWFFVRGLEGRQQTLISPSNDWRRWRNAYASELDRQLRRLAEALAPDLVTFVILWYDVTLLNFLRTTVDATTNFANADYVVVTDHHINVDQFISEEFTKTVTHISLEQLCMGLRTEFGQQEQGDSQLHAIPSLSGAPVTIPIEKERWLCEELEILHVDLARATSDGQLPLQEFLRGAVITWYELSIGKDAQRDKALKIEQRVRQDLSNRETVRIQLYHRPGAGGTTVARRILWNLHELYPCLSLIRSNPNHVEETAERLAYIYAITAKPVLLLVDSANVAERIIDDLFGIVRSKGTPIVMLLTSRRFESQTERNRSFQLDLLLSDTELPRFVEKYKNEVPERTPQISVLLNTRHSHERTAFNFGITAYGKDFRGIPNYVSSRLTPLNPQQKQALVFLAFAHYYGQRGIPAQAFAYELGLLNNREIRLDKVFENTEETLDLLIQEGNAWRVIHYFISNEILEQTLKPVAGDSRNWRQQLSTWSARFIQFCRGNHDIVSEEMRELVRRTFVYRDNIDLLGRETPAALSNFSKLIQDIPSQEGRLEVFRNLTEQFPEEAHFWAHSGRFLAAIMKNYDEALGANQHAINLQPDDHVLWHMQGMIYRYQAQGMMEVGAPLHEIVERAQKASECFEESRSLNPDDEHGYISEVQLIVKVLNYAGSQISGGAMQYLRQPQLSPYICEAFDRAENLLGQVRSGRAGENASPYEEQCRADLHRLYGDPQKALQIWDNMLTRTDVYLPSIRRQIVFTILDRDRSWDKMRKGNHDRIVQLLQDNIDEEPNDERDLRLWLQAVRYTTVPPTIEALIEKVMYWKVNTNSLDATYYLYVLYTLKALKGLVLEREQAQRYIEECRQISRYRRNRLKSFEWYGKDDGVKRLVHQSVLGEWKQTTEFWDNKHLLQRLQGVVSRVEGNESGYIEIAGLSAFFVPGYRKDAPITSNDVNRRVSFYLGFSYSGLRAWDVQLQA